MVRHYGYKIVIFEQTPYFKRLGKGTVLKDFAQELQDMGYDVFQDTLSAPRYASACRRQKLYVVGLKREVQARDHSLRP